MVRLDKQDSDLISRAIVAVVGLGLMIVALAAILGLAWRVLMVAAG